MEATFYLSGAVAVAATLMAVTRASAVHALLYLIVSLLAVAIIFFVLGAPFVAALEVIIYAGAVMVLFVFVIMFSRCIFCGYCEEACPTDAIQLTPDFEMGEYNRKNLVYEKEDLLIDGTGKYPGYNFYRVAGVAIGGKNKGEAENEAPPVDPHSLLP